jgi:hypothetical protein
MSDEYFDSAEPVEELYRGDESGRTFIRVNGANLNVEPGSDFKATVKLHAQEAGLGKFRVFMNGEEVKPSNAPEVISEGTNLELRPYDTAG